MPGVRLDPKRATRPGFVRIGVRDPAASRPRRSEAPESVTVRPARPDDARGIARVHVRGWQSAYENLLPREFLDGLSIDQRESKWRRMLVEPPTPASRVVVATADAGHVIGFAAIGPARDTDADGLGELMALYLLPAHVGRGVGHELHDAATALLAVAGFPGAILWVLRENARARAFYERHGWTADGIAKHAMLGGTQQVEVRYRIAFVGVA